MLLPHDTQPPARLSTVAICSLGTAATCEQPLAVAVHTQCHSRPSYRAKHTGRAPSWAQSSACDFKLGRSTGHSAALLCYWQEQCNLALAVYVLLTGHAFGACHAVLAVKWSKPYKLQNSASGRSTDPAVTVIMCKGQVCRPSSSGQCDGIVKLPPPQVQQQPFGASVQTATHPLY